MPKMVRKMSNNAAEIVNFNLHFIVRYLDLLIQLFQLELGWSEAGEKLVPSTLFNLLKYHLSLRRGMSSSVIKVLSGYSAVPKDKALLLSISNSEEEYKKWKVDEHGILDLLWEMPSLMIDSSVLVYHLKPLLPR